MPEAVDTEADTDVRTYTGKCPECGFTCVTVRSERIKHVCPGTLNRHTLHVY